MTPDTSYLLYTFLQRAFDGRQLSPEALLALTQNVIQDRIIFSCICHDIQIELHGRPPPLIRECRVKGDIIWVELGREAQDGRFANLFVRDRESTSDRVDEVDAKDMYDIFPNGVTSIGWHIVVKTADVPFCFASTVDVEVIVTFGRRPVPLGF